MSRGQLVPDATIVRVFLDRLEAADAVDGAILDGFPRTKIQAEALDDALAEAARQVDLAGYIEVPLEELVVRMASRRICTANGHVYNLVSNPPRGPASATSTGPTSSSATTTTRRRSGPGWSNRSRPCSRSSNTIATTASSVPSTAGSRSTPSPTSSWRPSRACGRSDHGHPQVPRPEIERMRRAGKLVGEVLDLIEGELRPGVSTARLDSIAEAHIRRVGRHPVLQGLSGHQPAAALPGQRLHLDRPRDRPRHPGRADHPRGSDRVGRRRGDHRRLARRRRTDLLRRGPAARRSRASSTSPAKR